MLRLPNEMLLEVFKKLHRRDRIHLGMSCRRLYAMSALLKPGLEDLPLKVLAQIMQQLPVKSLLAVMRSSATLRAAVLNKEHPCWRRVLFLKPYMSFGVELQQAIGSKSGVYPCLADFPFREHQSTVLRFRNCRLHPLHMIN